jgi:PAS domain S-box-containing protein
MDLNEFSRQIEAMQARFMQLSPTNGAKEHDLQLAWEQTSEALAVTMEEMRVAEEELYEQNRELEESRLAVESERQRYRDLFDFAPDGYLVTDLRGMIREANRAVGELLGVSARNLAGKPLASYIEMDERPGFRLGLSRMLQVGRREDWIIRMEPRRGSPYDASVTVAVVRDGHGTARALRWLIREVVQAGSVGPAARRSRSSGRVTIGLAGESMPPDDLQAERLARARVEDEAGALRGLLYGLDLIVWEADAETGRYWFISPRAEQVLGHPTERWLDDPAFWAEIIHPEDRALAATRRARCLRDRRPTELEYRVVAADGRVLWFRESLSVESDGEGNPTLIRGCLWDISRRKKVERQLYTDRSKLAEHLADVWHLYLLGGQLLASLEVAPVLEEVLAAVAALQGAEMAAIRLLDRDRDELEIVVNLGLSPAYLERFGRVRLGVEACGLAVRRGGPVSIEDVEAEADPAAAARWAESAQAGGFRACFSVPLVGRRGEVLGTVVTFFREPHRPSERQLHMVENYILQAADAVDNARRYEAARDSDRRKEEVIATLAHELRNPLAAIHNSMQLLDADGVDPAILGEVREVIARQARHMKRLIEDMLDMTRISRGTLSLRKEPVELADVIARAVEDVRPLVDTRGHRMEVSQPEGPLVIHADPTRLEQVLTNLLTNAAKYTERGGRIELTAAREGDELLIRVRDTGIGLKPEALSGLFDLFSQVNTNADRSGGLGIGLALVKSLVQLHGGSVSAHSDGPGRGSEFVVRLNADGGSREAGPPLSSPS